MLIIDSILLCLALFAGMLLLLEIGFRIGMRFRKTAGGEETGILDGAIFALLGLLLGFAFAGAVDRFGHRRDLIIHEANAIHTAYQRVDLLNAEDQPAVRMLFHSYIDARLKMYDLLDAGGDPQPAWRETGQVQAQLWSAALRGVNQDGVKDDAPEIVLPALNEMFEVATERRVALALHLPGLILYLLIAVSLLGALLAGNGMARSGTRHVLHAAIFAAAVSLTIYAILDLDHPRAGFIRLDGADRILEELRDSI
jgi:hypothetical protein